MAAVGVASTAAARRLCCNVSGLGSSRSWAVGKPSLIFPDGQFSGSVSYSVPMYMRHQYSNYTSASSHKFGVLMAQLGVVERESVRQASFAKTQQRSLSFVKYQGLGNDFLLVDNRDSLEPRISEEEAIRLCDRNFGVGGDGVIFLMPGVKGSDYSMRIFNSDGSEPEMCGNGIRCLARFVADLENVSGTRSYSIHTLAGIIIPELRDDGQVIVDMGPPTLNPADVPTKLPATKDGAVVQAPLVVDGRTWSVTCVSMGNPHCVTFGEHGIEGLDLSGLPLSHVGPLFENHEVFPAKINTHFVEVLSRSNVRMRVWERGAGPTLACGTGACAIVVAGVLEGRIERTCRVDLPGGPLDIEWNKEDNHVYMTGPGTAVFSGKAFL